MTTPLVSVVVTTYNHEAYIGAALDSVFAQTYTDYEIVVIDDGSTDATAARVAAFGSRVRYVHQYNRGVAAARNAGIEHARGALVALLDGDDLWEPRKLAVQVEAAAQYPRSGLVAVDGVQFGHDGVLMESLLGASLREHGGASTVVSGQLYDALLRGDSIATTSQVMIPRWAFDAVGLSDAQFPLANDYDLYLRIAARFPITIIKERLVRWRYLASSASGPADIRVLRWTPDLLRIWKRHLPRVPRDRRRALRTQIHARSVRASRGAYYFGAATDRVWATRYLVALAVQARVASPLLFLVALWCPAWMSRIGAGAMRAGEALRARDERDIEREEGER